MQAQVFLSNKYNKWRVIYDAQILSEWETEEVAVAYCAGYNEAIKDNERED